jgi:hypothetical protein
MEIMNDGLLTLLENFWADASDFNSVGHDWHTDNRNFYGNVEAEDIFWVVTSGGPESPSEWRLIERIVVANKNPGLVKTKHGHFHIIGDNERSVFFDLTWQNDFAPILRQLNFVSGKRIRSSGKLIGRTLQVARRLTKEDVELEGV